jgi:hypothetical protein
MPRLASLGSVLGVATGFYVGCMILGVKAHWPPEDQERWLLILFPAALGVEILGVFAVRRWPVWVFRLVIAASAARVLLHNTVYLEDLAGPGTREWAPAQAWLNMGGMAAVLAGVWAALVLLARRAPGRSIPLALAIVCTGAALAVMLSGYASGGQIGFPLAASLVGVALASLAFRMLPDLSGLVGIAVVGLFALLVVGCFFAQLPIGYAVLLFLAPLLGWLPELPYVARARPWLRGGVRVLLTAAPVALVLVLAQQKFVEDSARTAPGVHEPSLDDYMNFGN